MGRNRPKADLSVSFHKRPKIATDEIPRRFAAEELSMIIEEAFHEQLTRLLLTNRKNY